MDTQSTKRWMLKAAVLMGSSGCTLGVSCNQTPTSDTCHVW
jgi:hypothetical protein